MVGGMFQPMVVALALTCVGLSRLAKSELCLSNVCAYTLVIRNARTMTYTRPDKSVTYNVIPNGVNMTIVGNRFRSAESGDPYVGQTVSIDDVITGDGTVRDIITINDQLPGPTLRVMKGAQLEVTVMNGLEAEMTSVHFHGVRQLDTNGYDGVPYVTQCPILPGEQFVYRFKAGESGTRWYHSHYQGQRLDGASGMFIVHDDIPVMPEFPMFLQDYFHVPWEVISSTSPFKFHRAGTGEFELTLLEGSNNYLVGFNKEPPSDMHYTKGSDYILSHISHDESFDSDYESALEGLSDPTVDVNPYSGAYDYLYDVTTILNGRGRYGNMDVPYSMYHVRPGHYHRIRAVNAGQINNLGITIDRHILTVVAVDGNAIKPVEVNAIFMAPGERVDVIVHADQPPDRYWIRVTTVVNPIAAMNTKIGVFNYLENDFTEPNSTQSECTTRDVCIVFGCRKNQYDASDNTTCFSMDMVEAMIDRPDIYMALPGEYVYEFFYNLGYVSGPGINGIQHEQPGGRGSLRVNFCTTKNCSTGCQCTNEVALPFNRTIQLVLSNYDAQELPIAIGHPIHIHGHDLAVVAMGYVQADPTGASTLIANPDIDCVERTCTSPRWRRRPKLNLDFPVIKDTIMVPPLGYVVVRFRSDNPGRWFMHCHVNSHVAYGMALLFRASPTGSSHINRLPHCSCS